MDQMEQAGAAHDESRRKKSQVRAIVVFLLSLAVAITSAMELHGWHVYVGFGLVVVGLCFALLSFKRKHAAQSPPK